MGLIFFGFLFGTIASIAVVLFLEPVDNVAYSNHYFQVECVTCIKKVPVIDLELPMKGDLYKVTAKDTTRSECVKYFASGILAVAEADRLARQYQEVKGSPCACTKVSSL